MVSFASDYIAGAHPVVLERLCETNLVNQPGYGADEYCESARDKIRKACELPEAEVEFIAGGTETNQIVISSLLHDYEGVIAAETGHVSTHEAGAIEYSGHKVITLPQKEGKINADNLKNLISGFYSDENHEHMVFPGMVYISYPTEYGTLYSKAELESIAGVCHEHGMPLYIDGARLAYGLMSKACDLTLPDIARIADAFYIGGTKAGTLLGEAVVFTKGNKPKHFMNYIKKRGSLLAKGRVLGVQFDALFTDDLYFEIGSHAIEMAEKMKEIFKKHGYEFFLDSPTNQQFVVLPDEDVRRLSESVEAGFWEKTDETHTVLRFATSWSTTDEDLEALDKAL